MYFYSWSPHYAFTVTLGRDGKRELFPYWEKSGNISGQFYRDLSLWKLRIRKMRYQLRNVIRTWTSWSFPECIQKLLLHKYLEELFPDFFPPEMGFSHDHQKWLKLWPVISQRSFFRKKNTGDSHKKLNVIHQTHGGNICLCHRDC